MATTRHDDVREEGANAVDDAPHVDADHPLPCFDWPNPRVACAANACVVADDVHGTKALYSRRCQRIDLLDFTDVGDNSQRLDSMCASFVRGCGQCVFLYVGQDDRTTGGGEGVDER